jgi:hypothetical protein
MAGHIPRESIMMPVDYNDGEHPNRVKQEFSPNHRHAPAFLLLIENKEL